MGVMTRWGLAVPLALAALSGSLLGRVVDANLALIVIVGALVAVAIWQRRAFRVVCLCVLVWCAHDVSFHEAGRLPAEAAGHDFRLEGRVESLQQEDGRSRFRLSIERCIAPGEEDGKAALSGKPSQGP